VKYRDFFALISRPRVAIAHGHDKVRATKRGRRIPQRDGMRLWIVAHSNGTYRERALTGKPSSSAMPPGNARMINLFRHRGGAAIVAVVLSIAGWAVVIGVAHLLWRLF
jgi:hypothetical protein